MDPKPSARRRALTKGFGIFCLFLILFASIAQAVHTHREAKVRDCATCLVGHSPVVPTTALTSLVRQVESIVIQSAATYYLPDHHVRVYTIRPPPSA